MSTLRATIEAQALQFATAIVQALRSASLEELMSVAGGGGHAPPRPTSTKTNGKTTGAAAPARKGGRLGRRSADEIGRTLENIVAVLSQHPEGLRAEQIKAALQLDKREMPRPIAEGLRSGALKKTGQKRATVYTVGSGTSKARSARRK